MQYKILFIILLFIPTLLFSQGTGGLSLPMDWGGSEEKPNPENEKRKLTAQSLKSQLAGKSLESLTEREVENYLRELGVPTTGSIYAKRERLKRVMAIDDITPSLTLDSLPKKPESEERIQIKNAAEGELLTIDKTKGGVMVLRGKVSVKIGTGELRAETVSIDSDRQEIYAEGGIEYNDGAVRVLGEKFLYDFKLAKGVIYDSKASMYPAYFIGEKMKRLDEKRYLMEMGYFTACNAEIPHYTFKAKEILIYEDNSIVAFQLSYQVGGTTLFWLPMIYNSSSGNGWNLQAGKNNTQGWFLQNSYQWSDPYPDSIILPHGYQFRFDMYEKTGQAAQINMWKVSPWLNYNIDLGYANHKRNEITSAFEDRFRLGGIATTNQVDRGELFPNYGLPFRDIGQEYEPWWKTNININSKQNDVTKDGTRNIQLKYENQNQLNFDYEYGNRYLPSNSIQGLYTQRDQRFGLIRNMLDWSFDYIESRGDLTVSIGAKRNLFYQIQAEGYFPTMDTAPVIQILNSSQVGTTPYFESPIYWDLLFTNSTTKFYGPPVQRQLPFPPPGSDSLNDPFGRFQDFVLRSQNLTVGETGLRTTMPMGEYVSFTPSAHAGARQNTVDFPGSGNDINSPSNPANLAQRDFLGQDTFQYVRQNHELRIGVPALFLTTNYRKMDVDKVGFKDPIFGNARVNEAEIALESYALDDWEVSVRTIKDFRKYSGEYQPGPTESERWYFTVFRLSGFVDFLDGFKNRRPTLLERQRSFYSGVFINNDFVYHTPQNRPLSNHLTLSYKMGGFATPFIRNIRSFEAGGTWYHVYRNNFLDSYRFFLRTDVKVTRSIGMDFELDSRVTEPWRLTNFNQFDYYNLGMDQNMFGQETGINYNRTNLYRDIAQGLGAEGSSERQKTVFNINRFMTTLKMNLHNWEYRIGYSMNLRAFPGGFAGDRQLTFYDQSVFFSVSLTNFSLGSQDGTPATRARIYRFRKQPLDTVDGQLRGEIN
ncbi:MAG: LPS-assembly protein LptD [Leptospira sp.]|nr:LPS-assembly protein LptD [Leptospira sp.]